MGYLVFDIHTGSALRNTRVQQEAVTGKKQMKTARDNSETVNGGSAQKLCQGQLILVAVQQA